MIACRLRAWLRQRQDRVWVRLTFADGSARLLGPMDRYGAEVFLAIRMAPEASWDGRRVVSARIVGRS